MSLEPILAGSGEDPQLPLVIIIEMAINLVVSVMRLVVI